MLWFLLWLPLFSSLYTDYITLLEPNGCMCSQIGSNGVFRRELATRVHDCKFIIPASTGKVTVVGICTEGRIIQARGGNTYQAYQKLNRKIAELLLHAA